MISLEHHYGAPEGISSTPFWSMAQSHRIGAGGDVSSVNNIQRLREARKWSRPTLGARMGTSGQQVERLEKGQRKLTQDWIDKAAAALGVAPTDIIAPLGDDYQPSPDQLSSKTDGDGDAVEIQEWNFAYGMGGGTFLDLPVTGDTHQFSRSWLRQFTHAPPDKIFLARGTGDSMMPTILDADIVIIDTSERIARVGDKIWALVYGEVGLIKRVRPMPDGSFKMLSDNPVVDPETAYDGEMSFVGRVVAIIRKT